MLDFQQKRKVRSYMYNRVTLGLLLLVLIIVIHSTWVVYRKKVESEELRDVSLKNVESLRVRSEDLQIKIDRLNTKQGVEEEVRSKFSVAKDDENMVIIVQDEPSTTEEVKKGGFWSSFKSLWNKK